MKLKVLILISLNNIIYFYIIIFKTKIITQLEQFMIIPFSTPLMPPSFVFELNKPKSKVDENKELEKKTKCDKFCISK